MCYLCGKIGFREVVKKAPTKKQITPDYQA